MPVTKNDEWTKSPPKDREKGTVWLGTELVYRISDEARNRAKKQKLHSVWGDGKEILDRQNRILKATKLPLLAEETSRWWMKVEASGRSLARHMHINKEGDPKEYADIAKASLNLKNLLVAFFENYPEADEPHAFSLIADLHALEKNADAWAKSFPKRERTRPKKDNERNLIKNLALCFREGFNKEPKQTRGGSFERFITALIFEIGGVERPKGWLIEKMRGGGKSELF